MQINFSVALAVALAHAGMWWLLEGAAPESPVIRSQDAVVAKAITDAVIVKEPRPASRATSLEDSIVASAPSVAPATSVTATPTVISALEAVPAQANNSSAFQVPQPIRLHYTLTKGTSSANAVLTWQPKQNPAGQPSTYELTLEASTVFVTLLRQTSAGQLTSQGLAPTRYADKRVRKSEQAVHFEAVNRKVSFSNNRPEAIWLEGSQDRLSVLVQLAALAQGRATSNLKPWRAGEVIELPVASTDELELWQWEVQPAAVDQSADAAAGSLKLLRRPRKAFDASIELWLSEALGYLPVRIRQTDSSGVADQVLVRAEAL